MAQVKYSNGDINMLKAGFDNLMKSYELEGEGTPAQLIHATLKWGVGWYNKICCLRRNLLICT